MEFVPTEAQIRWRRYRCADCTAKANKKARSGDSDQRKIKALKEVLTESADVIGTAHKELDYVLAYWDTFTGGHTELKAKLSALKYILDDSRARAALALAKEGQK